MKPPSPQVYEEARHDPLAFWEGWARELSWMEPWQQVLDWNPPHARWFVGGKLNAASNCLDRHLPSLGSKPAIIWEGEPGESRVLSYRQLYEEVCRLAHALRKLGVKRGDRVGIYLPMIPELPIAMLACARIGAVHSVVFAGFSAEALCHRLNDAQARVLITADGGYRRGNLVPLKQYANQALAGAPSVEKVIVVHRLGQGEGQDPGRELSWEELVRDCPPEAEAEAMDSQDSLFILYTSGTTGRPKGVVHATGGYLVGVLATTHWVFDLREEDIYWCTADIGWITGHSYIVYGPLACGATVVMYEGAPDWPDRDRFWSIVEKYGVTILYTAPTAIRAFMGWGEDYPRRHNLSSLRLLGSVGEPINPEAWHWYYRVIGGGRCPIVDTWWQTETGMILLTPMAGVTAFKPGSAGLPFPGIQAQVVDEEGKPLHPGERGFLVITTPWPAMLKTIYGDHERYVKEYWGRIPGRYFTGDGAFQDEEGYFWLLGRVDDVMNVAGHRLSTVELESAIAEHPAVAEAAVIGKAHSLKGQAVSAFVRLRDGLEGSPALAGELRGMVARKISPIARPDDVIFVAELPKTRSGKIMRRLLRDIAEGRVPGDLTTLSDPCAIAELKKQYEVKGGY